MEFWRSVSGIVEAELISAQPELVISALNSCNVEVFQIRQNDPLTWQFHLARRDYSAAVKICEKQGAKLRRLRTGGVYWLLKGLARRPVLTIGMGLLLALCLFLPSRVLFIQVDGNRTVPSRQIIAAAEDCGIRFWASRKEVRSEQMKNSLLSALPQLQWAGVNTRGCVAVISVRERAEETEERKTVCTGIAAGRDGYILSATATRGNLLVQPGQTVKKGQLLISGYTDCGICIRFAGAEGEVLAQTVRDLEAVTPLQWQMVLSKSEPKKKISLLLGKKRINLWKDSGISGGSCGRMYEEYYVTLPGGFQLPVALCVDRWTDYEVRDVTVQEDLPEESLRAYASAYLTGQMVAGSILSGQEQLVAENGICRLRGTYLCKEMIATHRLEQIGDTNGKIN